MRKKQLHKVPLLGDNIYPLDGSPDSASITNNQGLKLAVYSWQVDDPKAAILLVHGVQTHARFEFLRHLQPGEPDLPLPDAPAGTHKTEGSAGMATNTTPEGSGLSHQYARWCIYEGSWVHQLNAIGCSVYAVDLESFGFSEGWKGRRCSVERLDNLALDVICFAEYVEKDLSRRAKGAAPPPMFLMGISMGGFSVVRALELMGKCNHSLIRAGSASPDENQARLAGCIALAPMLSVEKASSGALNKSLAKIGGILSRLAPHLGVAKLHPARFPWIDFQKDEDPLVTSPLRLPCRLALEALASIPKVHADAQFIPDHLRVLIIHAEQDTLVEPAGSIRFHNESAKHITERQLLLLQGDRGHYLIIEPENSELIAKIIEWINV
ncbi:uncharacterized protein LOC34623467 [Cyclospora cayetanensis]|uniref:Uncharacterized protein LOC34623467 n=2 Tax=Cyclospora cayetanensis TaxID=88456 RepID=A0A6P5WDA0_9EIME|nr:uncharacterized protein LOC34623467 [Cyclospora cayetanensis]OEH76551.1 hypothetical protein cyc_07516 [Cyclospora cayetanensis]